MNEPLIRELADLIWHGISIQDIDEGYQIGDTEKIARIIFDKVAVYKDAKWQERVKPLVECCYEQLRRYANLSTGGSEEAALLAKELRQFLRHFQQEQPRMVDCPNCGGEGIYFLANSGGNP